MLAMKRLLNRFSYSLVWCNKINCAAIQDQILGGPVRLQLGDIQQEMQEIRGRGKFDDRCRAEICLMTCDPEERPMAVISPDGRWHRNDTDNGQGSPRIRWGGTIHVRMLEHLFAGRCDRREFERGKLILKYF